MGHNTTVRYSSLFIHTHTKTRKKENVDKCSKCNFLVQGHTMCCSAKYTFSNLHPSRGVILEPGSISLPSLPPLPSPACLPPQQVSTITPSGGGEALQLQRPRGKTGVMWLADTSPFAELQSREKTPSPCFQMASKLFFSVTTDWELIDRWEEGGRDHRRVW